MFSFVALLVVAAVRATGASPGSIRWLNWRQRRCLGHSLPIWVGGVCSAFGAVCVVVFVIDLREHVILDQVMLPALAVAVVANPCYSARR